MKRINELESMLVDEKETITTIGTRLGNERARYKKLKQQAILMNNEIKELRISNEKLEDRAEDSLLMQDEIQAKLDAAALFLNCVKNNGNIFFETPHHCEICWINYQEVVLSCKHSICINCVVELRVLGQATGVNGVQPDENFNYLSFYMACPLCRGIIESISIVK